MRTFGFESKYPTHKHGNSPQRKISSRNITSKYPKYSIESPEKTSWISQLLYSGKSFFKQRFSREINTRPSNPSMRGDVLLSCSKRSSTSDLLQNGSQSNASGQISDECKTQSGKNRRLDSKRCRWRTGEMREREGNCEGRQSEHENQGKLFWATCVLLLP